jgi:hypothetical protein
MILTSSPFRLSCGVCFMRAAMLSINRDVSSLWLGGVAAAVKFRPRVLYGIRIIMLDLIREGEVQEAELCERHDHCYIRCGGDSKTAAEDWS